MILKRKKTRFQLAMAASVLSRLEMIPKDLLDSGEPMFSMRIGSIISEIRTALSNAEAVDG